MPKFESTFILYKGGKEVLGDVKPQIFYTKSYSRGEFWEKLNQLERKLSEKHKGSVCHLIVTSLEDMPGVKIKKGEIVAYNSLAL